MQDWSTQLILENYSLRTYHQIGPLRPGRLRYGLIDDLLKLLALYIRMLLLATILEIIYTHTRTHTLL